MSSFAKLPYRYIYFSGLILFILAAYFSEGYFHPDEHFQILEFCNYKLGLSSAIDLPWEFNEKIRPALQPLLAVGVIRFLMMIHIDNPFIWALILRVLTALFSWFVISKMTLYLAKDFTNEVAKILLVLLSFFLWFMPVISVRYSSENYGGLTFLLAIYSLFVGLDSVGKKKIFQFIFAGLLFGFSFFFRFQMGFAIAGMGMWLLWVKKINWWSLTILILSGTTAMLISTIADFVFYGTWTCTPLNYLIVNIIEHKAAHWGVHPWWHYFTMFINGVFPPVSIVLLILFLIGLYQKPKHILTWCILPFIIGHMLVGHKEMRFMFPAAFMFIFLVSQGIDYFISKKKYQRGIRIMFLICLLINIPLLIITSVIPARDSVCYFKFLYQNFSEHTIELLSTGSTVYETVGLEVNFYRTKSVHCNVVYNAKEEIEYVHNTQPDSLYVLERDQHEDNIYQGYEKEIIYSLFPGLILKNNFFHWQDRTRIWRIMKLKKIK